MESEFFNEFFGYLLIAIAFFALIMIFTAIIYMINNLNC